MTLRPLLRALIWLAPCLCFVCPVIAADERIERALRFAQRTNGKVVRDQVDPHWLPGGKSFWYRVTTGSLPGVPGPGSQEFVLVDCVTGEKKSAATLAELKLPEADERKTSELSTKIRPSTRTGESSALKVVNKLDSDVQLFWIDPDGEKVRYEGVRANGEREQHSYAGHFWLIADRGGEPLAVVEVEAATTTIVVDGKSAVKIKEEPAKRPRDRHSSPDGKYRVLVERSGVSLKDLETSETLPLKSELNDKDGFRNSVSWSPDSSAFVVTWCQDVPRRRITIVDSSPKDQLQPTLMELDYIKPGDPLLEPVLVLFRVSDPKAAGQKVSSPLIAGAYHTSPEIELRWADDGSEFYFDVNQRGHQAYRIVAVNAQTGDVRAVAEEISKTFIDYTNKTWRHWLPETAELLWMSERDGWCHLYLIDVKTGQVKNAVTQGKWVTRRVLHVDEKSREVWILASGMRAEEDPYHQHLCRAKFDGGEVLRLTEGDGQHRITFSPDREHFLDTWSRVDQPPVTELRRSRDGKLVCTCERADADSLVKSGWSLPERFVAKGRDGETDIYGILIKPSNFDPTKKYPVVEEIYAGPHSAHVPKEFGRLNRQHGMAELGFIVVQIDGMGTNHRGKAFHDVCWKNLKDAGFPDRIAWMKTAAETRPWMDLSRVGIYGGSAGGQNAMRAVLDHHDFYRVAVADCGCHDNRMDKLWWNEQWMGWPIDDSYARSSNRDDAHKLGGKLLLIVGELDTNVDPASTMQVVGALQKAGKTFDYLPIVGTGHGAAETPYGSRARMEFLVRHLLP